MATKSELETAHKVISEIAGAPDSGVIAELLHEIASKASEQPTKEARVVEVKETR